MTSMTYQLQQLAEFLRYFVECHQAEIAPVRISIFGARSVLHESDVITHPIKDLVAGYLAKHLTHQQPTIHQLGRAAEVLSDYYGTDTVIGADFKALEMHLDNSPYASYNPIPFGFDEVVNEIEANRCEE